MDSTPSRKGGKSEGAREAKSIRRGKESRFSLEINRVGGQARGTEGWGPRERSTEEAMGRLSRIRVAMSGRTWKGLFAPPALPIEMEGKRGEKVRLFLTIV